MCCWKYSKEKLKLKVLCNRYDSVCEESLQEEDAISCSFFTQETTLP